MNTSEFNNFLIKRQCNGEWLWNCLENSSEAFPYRIKEGGNAKLPIRFSRPKNQNKINPSELAQPAPRFVVTIPDGRRPSLTPNKSKIGNMLTRLKDESFSTRASSSSQKFKSRVAVVIATNQVKSLDSEYNKAFISMIRNTRDFVGTASRLFGFLWKPEYVQTARGTNLYTAKKSFCILKALSREQAEKVRSLVEEKEGHLHPHIRSQIPYRQIREKLLKISYTRSFVDFFERSAPKAPIYFTTMDNDFISLRIGDGVGIFEKASNLIAAKENLVSVIGAGYQPKEDEKPIIRLGVKIDMAVRVAMTRVIPYSAYCPEPFLCVLARRPGAPNHIRKLTFRSDKKDPLESRRIIQNGRDAGILDDHMAFIRDGIVTSSPARWKTEKNDSYPVLDARTIKKKKILQAFRGLSQAHSRVKIWADQVYNALKFKTSSFTDATAPMMHIFRLFDPISRMFDTPGRFSRTTFDQVMNNYSDDPNDLDEGQLNVLNTAKAKLVRLKMDNEQIELVVKAARESGFAIYEELTFATEDS